MKRVIDSTSDRFLRTYESNLSRFPRWLLELRETDESEYKALVWAQLIAEVRLKNQERQQWPIRVEADFSGLNDYTRYFSDSPCLILIVKAKHNEKEICNTALELLSRQYVYRSATASV